MSHLTSRLRRLARRFGASRSGNVSLMFGLSLVPLVGLAGIGVDYGVALSAKSKLDNAADAAALAAVASAKAYVAANENDPNVTQKAVAQGLDRAARAFKVNAGSVALATTPTPNITLKRQGQTFSSSVSYSTTTKAQFSQIFNGGNLTVSGAVAASADVPSYLDFYLLMDVSGSMGIPTSPDDQTTLYNANGNCQFACHFPASAGGGDGYSIATTGYRNDGTKVLDHPLQLRSGAVNNALCQLLTRAAAPAVKNQYRVGLYPFINQVATLAQMTTDIASLQKTADCASNPPMALTSLLDTDTTQFYVAGNPATGTGAGGTHFETTLPGMQTLISPYGDGSSAARSKPFVFLITDGMDNNQHFSVQSGSSYLYVGNPNTKFTNYTSSSAGWDGSQPQAWDPLLCKSLRDAGATVSILYIPYVQLTVGPQNPDETKAVDNLIPQVASTLKSCASPGFFYTASSQSDIANALGAMFNQAVQVAHLSK